MAPTPKTPGGRPITVAAKVSRTEAAYIDARRGSLTRSEWLRKLLIDDRRAHGEPRT